MKLLALLALLAPLTAAAAEIPAARALDADGRRADAERLPVVLLYSATWCAWCTAVKDEFFQHMVDDPAYRERIILREVTIDSQIPLVDFAGSSGTHQDFATAGGVRLVPTVRFVDGGGQQLAAEMVGVTTLDYYGWYLDRRIEQALDRLRTADGG